MIKPVNKITGHCPDIIIPQVISYYHFYLTVQRRTEVET